MTIFKQKLIVGTRSSKLAMAQTNQFIKKLLAAYPEMPRDSIEVKTIKTSGDQNQTDRLDQIGGKGLFAKEIEMKIKNGEIDIGIHSMKDMPANDTTDLSIGCCVIASSTSVRPKALTAEASSFPVIPATTRASARALV